MFDSKTTFPERLTDAVDLVIDFATLGEYGLEPIELRVPACEGRSRGRAVRATGSWSAALNRFATPHA